MDGRVGMRESEEAPGGPPGAVAVRGRDRAADDPLVMLAVIGVLVVLTVVGVIG